MQEAEAGISAGSFPDSVLETPAGESVAQVFDILRNPDQTRVRDALKDLVMLAGVLKDLASERFWHEPRFVFDTLRTFDLLLKSTFYAEEAIQGEQELLYRFEKEYGAGPTIDISRLVRLGRRYNWITGPGLPPLKFTGTGKRMVTQFFRLANDALAYHGHVLKELHQAERDLQLARAYEDVGVGRHDTIASVLNNLENALNDLRYQREKYIQDRRALERYHAVIGLLEMLERELEKRFSRLEGIVDRKLEGQHRKGSILFYRLLQELSALLGENAYLSQLQVGRKIMRVDREKFVQYLVDVYEGSLPGKGLTPLQVLKYMEDGIYDDEEDDVAGLWVPFTLPVLLQEQDVERGVILLNDWIENWAPPAQDDLPDLPPCRPARRVTSGELNDILGATTSIAAELATDTRPLVAAVRDHPGVSMAGLLRVLGGQWPQAIRNMFVLGYLVTVAEVRLFTYRPNDGDDSEPGPAGREEVPLGDEPCGDLSWRLDYPDGRTRYVKGTPLLGRHLQRKEATRTRRTGGRAYE